MKAPAKIAAAYFLIITTVNAQSLSVGLIGGAPFNDVINGSLVNGVQAVTKSANFTLGPALQVNLPLNLRLEVDALYRPADFTLTIVSPATGALQLSSGSYQFRFPILAQYRFSLPLVKPFVEAGLSYDHIAGVASAFKSVASGPGQLLHASDAGVVLGAGGDIKIPFIRVSGELRFTRQTVSNFANLSNLNQAEALVGIHF